MSHLANWNIGLSSPSVRPYGEGKDEEDVTSLVYYEIAVALLEFMMEEDRKNRGRPIYLDECCKDITHSEEVEARYPGISEEAVQRVIATLSTPTPLPFKSLGGRVLKDPTAIIRKVAARGIDRYYLTDTGLMLCGLSHTADDIENLDLDMLMLKRFLKRGQFHKFISTCNEEVNKIHKLSSYLIKISKEPTFDSQWAMISSEGERVTKTLKKTRKLALGSYKVLESESVQNDLMKAAENNIDNIALESKIEEALRDVVSALNGLRINFADLLTAAQHKRHTLVPVIDFFQCAVNQFEEGNLADQLIDSHLATFGLVTPRHTNKEDDSIWASASAFELLHKIQRREATEKPVEKTLTLPPKEQIVDLVLPFDEMLGAHGPRLVALIKEKGTIQLEEYIKEYGQKDLDDASISSLYSLFVDPSPLNFFDVDVHSSICAPYSTVEWERQDGKELHFTNVFLTLRG